MKPLMIHADGIACTHVGPPQATPADTGGVVCAGGQRVTHAVAGGRKVTIGEAWQSLVDAYGPPGQAREPNVEARP